MSVLVRTDRLVTATAVVEHGWVLVEDGRVAAVGSGEAPRHDSVVEPTGTVLPGFVDLHAHGALGHDFASCTADEARTAVAHHAGRGTTAVVASVATGTPDATEAALRRLRPLVADGTLAGLHLEGPWLAPSRRGAHAADLLHAPTTAEVERFLDAGGGALRIVTLAPELPGASDAITRLADAGVVVAIGHTDADADTTRRAVDAGATLVTHLFNGMPPLHHRAPGPVGVALTDDRLTVELIVDGHHLDDTTVDLVLDGVGGRAVLVSDAMAATGCPDGEYRIAGSAVVVTDGVAMLADGSSLAGSTSTVADGVARLLARSGTPTTAQLVEAVTVSSANAARLLGLPGPLSVGSRADLVHIAPGTDSPRPLVVEASA
ncbi:N-acetylglucosamine-6-phosphate deacetylase [Curtobacterium sp. 9128]|uniref:N-acetylglucosamine-6-phosphate deacetylase n=1 Tax=Curtobacterium sp. 9128 TaxID=1793722 RepID=UPI0021B490AB|nr:N-acetylglucosamine-6-phosphate deacetylase [Curtobacterium sp. 9128]